MLCGVCDVGSDTASCAASDRVAQHLDCVQVGDRAALGAGEAGQVHEARHVSADQNVGLRFEDVIEFQRAHPTVDVGNVNFV